MPDDTSIDRAPRWSDQEPAEFFRRCDQREVGQESDWEVQRQVIGRSRECRATDL